MFCFWIASRDTSDSLVSLSLALSHRCGTTLALLLGAGCGLHRVRIPTASAIPPYHGILLACRRWVLGVAALLLARHKRTASLVDVSDDVILQVLCIFPLRYVSPTYLLAFALLHLVLQAFGRFLLRTFHMLASLFLLLDEPIKTSPFPSKGQPNRIESNQIESNRILQARRTQYTPTFLRSPAGFALSPRRCTSHNLPRVGQSNQPNLTGRCVYQSN